MEVLSECLEEFHGVVCTVPYNDKLDCGYYSLVYKDYYVFILLLFDSELIDQANCAFNSSTNCGANML